MKSITAIGTCVMALLSGGFIMGCASRAYDIPISKSVAQSKNGAKLAPYYIQPGDSLDVKFFYNPELNESVTVRPDGKISLQLVNEIMAAGQKPSDLDKKLTDLYAQEVRKPVIAVIVRSFAGQRIYVGGEVNDQKQIILPPGMTALQAIFQAGGLKETASLENAILIRLGRDKEPIPIQMNLKDALSGRGGANDPVLQPNDIVYIPKTAIAEVNKFVHQYIEKLVLFRGFSAGITYEIRKSRD